MKYLDKIVCGDCMDVLADLPEQSVSLFVIDPPYNIGYKYNSYQDNLVWEEYYEGQIALLNLAKTKLVPAGSIVWLNYPEQAAEVWTRVRENISDLNRVEWITWIYHQHTGGKPLRRATRAWLWFSKGEPFINQEHLLGEYRNIDDKRVQRRIQEGFKPVDYDWWFYEQVKNVSSEKVNHPCQLPLAMVKRFIELTTRPGEIVCDPYSGSGTTCCAAKKYLRHWIGVDIDPKYVEEATIRIEATAADLLGVT